MQGFNAAQHAQAVQAFNANAMRFACGKVKVLRYGKRIAVPLATQHTVTHVQGSAGLAELAVQQNFIAPQYVPRTCATAMLLAMRTNAHNAALGKVTHIVHVCANCAHMQ